MKAVYLNIANDVSAGTYDPTKTSILGHVTTRTINSNTCFAPPQPILADTFTDAAIAPLAIRYTLNNRIFSISAIAAGVATVLLHNLDSVTGVSSYVGKIVVTFPNLAATTHTIRGFRIVDTGTTGWKIAIATTGSILINSGTFVVNKVDLADFGPVSFYTFPMASTLAVTAVSTVDAKAVYFYQDPAALGATHAQTATSGVLRDSTNNFLFSHNGLSTVHQYYKYNLATAPQIAGGLQAVTVVTVATPAVFTATAHGYGVNDQVILVTTGAVPTPFTPGVVYFVRNPTANTFELSSSTGGASLNSSGSQSGTHQVLRAFGISSNAFSLKTGNLPILTGTLLQTNSEDMAIPDHGGVLIETFDCASFATTSNFYIGRLSELTSLTTTWPSLTTCNLLGTTNQITAPVATFCNWDDVLQCFIYVTNTSLFIAKKIINNSITKIFGGLNNTYLEGTTPFAPPIGDASISAIDLNNGWFFTSGSTVGQRIITGADLQSDASFEYSELYTSVIPNNGSTANFLATIEEYFDITTTMSFAFRVGALADAQWATKNAGTWIDVAQAEILSISPAEAIQIRVLWDIMTELSSIPAQLVDLAVAYTPPDEMSDNWVGSLKHSSLASASPFYIAFRLQNAYYTPVPQFRIDIIDDANNTVQTFDSITDIASIGYTTNDGVSWTPMGTVPNVALTTEIRVLVSSPPAGKLRARIIEV